jgi:alkaline phosphatase
MAAGSETHGGTDVFLGAIGKGADSFTGVIDNTGVRPDPQSDRPLMNPPTPTRKTLMNPLNQILPRGPRCAAPAGPHPGRRVRRAALAAGEAKNVIFFLGDGMGPATVTASRIYKYGEAGQLTMETLKRTARIKTYSLDAQTTDSAPSMAAYMTGVKMNNEVSP